MALKENIQGLATEIFDEIRGIRQHIHANPELSYKEFETAKYVSSVLNDWGIEHKTGVADTGIVATIKGNDSESEVKALRADMDALPILEENDVEYKSTNAGVMHACGHDVHTSSLLGAARILNATKDQWSGTKRLLFQPGEERLPGGASIMIKEGVLQNPIPANIIGQHVYPQLEAGKVGFKGGLYMASADEIYMTVKGKGGHAAIPHNNTDTVLICSHIIVALQQVVSRNANPETPTVLSFGKIDAPGATNIIPAEIKIEGTFRTFDEKWRYKAHDTIRQIAKGVAESMGGSVDVNIMVGYPFLINDEELTASRKKKAEDYLGKENVVDLSLRMTAEDFAYYGQQIPGCFYRLGTASPDGSNAYPLHNSRFNVDEKSIEVGMGMMAWLSI